MENHSHQDEDVVEILQVPINRISFSDATKQLVTWALGQTPRHVVTVNPEFVMIAQKDAEFLRVLRNASMRLADGIGIILASRLLGKPVKERATGVDTVRALVREGSSCGIRFFLLGAAPGIAEKAADVLRKEYPGVQIVGTYAGSPRPEEEDYICDLIRAAHPQVLLVAYGAPAQDKWIARTMPKLQIPISIGVGGTLDFFSGNIKRAPRWMQRLGIEWVFRLLQEPRRWRRMLRLPIFAVAVMIASLKQVFKKKD